MTPSEKDLALAAPGSDSSLPIWLEVPLYALGAAVLGALAIKLCGAEPLPALKACFAGALGSANACGETLNRLLALGLPALAIVLSFRAGIFNIGAEGQILCGAAGAAAWSAKILPEGTPWIFGAGSALLVGALCGAAWSLLAGLLKSWRGVSEVISTIMLNLIAQQGLRYLLNSDQLLRSTRTIEPRGEILPNCARLPEWDTFPVQAGFLLLPIAALGLYWLLFRTRAGLCVRAVGFNPFAARAAGMPVRAVELGVFAGAGALSGLSGAAAILALGYLPNSAPYPEAAFMAVAAALCARLHPLGVLPSAFLFAALQSGANEMERSAGVPKTALYFFEGLVILVLLSRGLLLPGASRLRSAEGAV